jgi:hypothetical protein
VTTGTHISGRRVVARGNVTFLQISHDREVLSILVIFYRCKSHQRENALNQRRWIAASLRDGLARRALQNDAGRLTLQEAHAQHHHDGGGGQANDKAAPEPGGPMRGTTISVSASR